MKEHRYRERVVNPQNFTNRIIPNAVTREESEKLSVFWQKQVEQILEELQRAKIIDSIIV